MPIEPFHRCGKAKVTQIGQRFWDKQNRWWVYTLKCEGCGMVWHQAKA
jgi:hypothetical protein